MHIGFLPKYYQTFSNVNCIWIILLIVLWMYRFLWWIQLNLIYLLSKRWIKTPKRMKKSINCISKTINGFPMYTESRSFDTITWLCAKVPARTVKCYKYKIDTKMETSNADLPTHSTTVQSLSTLFTNVPAQ